MMKNIADLNEKLDGIFQNQTDITAAAKEKWVQIAQLSTDVSSTLANFPFDVPIGGNEKLQF